MVGGTQTIRVGTSGVVVVGGGSSTTISVPPAGSSSTSTATGPQQFRGEGVRSKELQSTRWIVMGATLLGIGLGFGIFF